MLQRAYEESRRGDACSETMKAMRPDEHPEWSRLHTALRLRYMRRRCEMRKASGKFDENTTMKIFESTTMRNKADGGGARDGKGARKKTP